MTQEEKQLLLRDLCARLPYKPHIRIKDGKVDLDVDAVLNGTYIHDWITLPSCQNVTITPYLRPMSSMTEEEAKEFAMLQTDFYSDGWLYPIAAVNMVDWLKAHHFDFRGLIPMGLALEAPEGMYEF